MILICQCCRTQPPLVCVVCLLTSRELLQEAPHTWRWLPRPLLPRCPGTYVGQGCCYRCLAENRGMHASLQPAARCRHMCHERAREREPSTRTRTSDGARSRGLESSSVDRRAVLGHSIVDRSTRRFSFDTVLYQCVK